jgi:hypothetical protein
MTLNKSNAPETLSPAELALIASYRRIDDRKMRQFILRLVASQAETHVDRRPTLKLVTGGAR